MVKIKAYFKINFTSQCRAKKESFKMVMNQMIYSLSWARKRVFSKYGQNVNRVRAARIAACF